MVFAAVMLVAGQLYIESKENRSARIPTAVQTAYFRYDDLLSFPELAILPRLGCADMK